MADINNVLKAELGVKSDEHQAAQHHHDKVIVPSQESDANVSHVLQSQLGHGKEADQEIQQSSSK